jgi:hypothetical protein
MNETADEVFNLRATFWGVQQQFKCHTTDGRSFEGKCRYFGVFVGCFVGGMKTNQRLYRGKSNDKTGIAKNPRRPVRNRSVWCGWGNKWNGHRGTNKHTKKEEKKERKTELYAMNDTSASRLLALRMNENYRHTHTHALVEIKSRVFTKK